MYNYRVSVGVVVKGDEYPAIVKYSMKEAFSLLLSFMLSCNALIELYVNVSKGKYLTSLEYYF